MGVKQKNNGSWCYAKHVAQTSILFFSFMNHLMVRGLYPTDVHFCHPTGGCAMWKWTQEHRLSLCCSYLQNCTNHWVSSYFVAVSGGKSRNWLYLRHKFVFFIMNFASWCDSCLSTIMTKQWKWGTLCTLNYLQGSILSRIVTDIHFKWSF